MTPKEKAENLLNEMSKQTYSVQPYAGATFIEEEVGYEAGKKCALICVEKQLELINTINNDGADDYYEGILQIKEELIKL